MARPPSWLDFASAPSIMSECNAFLLRRWSRAQCVRGLNGTFGCAGDSASATLWVSHGCRGTFVCNGLIVTCDGVDGQSCACVAGANNPGPSAAAEHQLQERHKAAIQRIAGRGVVWTFETPCQVSTHNWDGSSGVRVRLASQYLKSMARFGCWRRSTEGERLEGATDGYFEDHTYVPVIRVATDTFSNSRAAHIVHSGEGGARGCFFFSATGSDAWLPLGRSLRAANRSHAASLLAVDIGRTFGALVSKGLRPRTHAASAVPGRRGPRSRDYDMYHNNPREADLLLHPPRGSPSSADRRRGIRHFLANPYILDHVRI